MKNNLIEGKIFNVLMAFALPYFLSSFLQTFYGMADLYIVGRFEGAASLSAVSIGSQFMNLLTVIITGLAMGATVSIGQAIGSQNKKEVSRIIVNAAFIFLIIALLATVVLCLNTSLITSIMSTPIEAINNTKDYLFVCFMGIPFIIAYNVISSIYRGMGDSKSPMYFILMACIINVSLDYYFIGVLSFGAKGAAYATVIAQAISSIIAIICLMKKKDILVFQKDDIKFNTSIVKRIFNIGLPIAMQNGFIQISFLIITIIANNRGLISATSVGVVEKLIGFLFLIPSALLSAISVLVAHNVGANKHDRATQVLKYAMVICVSCGIFFAAICQVIPGSLVSIFTKDNEVIIAGIQYLRSYSFDCIFAGIHFCFSGYFCGYQYSTISFIHNIISVIVIRIPVAYVMSIMFKDTLFPMGIASPLGSVLSVLICIGYYIYLKKKKLIGVPNYNI